MKSPCIAGLGATMLVSLSMTVFAQSPETQAPRPQAPAPSPAAQSTENAQTVTVTGCVQREADYRQARGAGRGGVVGTGVGAGNEFVLVNASMSAGAQAGAAAPTGTSGSAAEFELTGPNEGKVAQYAGRRVEIAGTLKAAEAGAAGRPTGGPTAGKPPEGIDVAGGDLKLRELEVTSVRESAGTCAPLK